MLLTVAVCLLAGICQTGFDDAADAGPSGPARSADGLLSLEIIPDAWPTRVRTIGYEFNQKNHQAAPEFVDRGGMMRGNPGTGKRYRVVGLRFRNATEAPIGIRYRSDRLDKGKSTNIEVPALGFATRVGR